MGCAEHRGAGRPGTLVGLAALALAVGGCTGDSAAGGAAAAPVVRDSAGVQIVESAAPAWGERGGLELDSVPMVAIGEEGGPQEAQLFQVRSGFRLADGRIAIFDGGANELRFFDAGGAFLSKVGGKGGGPGEFQFASWVARLPGDSMMVHDIMGQRITVFAPDGAIGRTINLAKAAPPPSEAEGEAERGGGAGRTRMVMMGMGRYEALAPLADGSLLARVRGQGAPEGGAVARDSVLYLRLDAEGEVRDTIGRFAGDEVQMSQGGRGEQQLVMFGPPPFGRTAQVQADGDGFYYSSSDRYEIGRYDAEGKLVRLIRRPVQPLPVRPEDGEVLKAREMAPERFAANPQMAAGLKLAVESKWENVVLPETMPAHGPLIVDRARRLWVRVTTPPADSVPRYDVFDREGAYQGVVTLPIGFRVLEIGEDYVLGVGRDEMDVEQVRMHALRPARPRA